MLVKTQVKAAPAFTADPGMVRTPPANDPIGPVLPVTALFPSVQLAAVRKNVGATPSVKVTALPITATLIAAGAAGVAVPATNVFIAEGALVKLVWVNENGPPTPPTVVFWTATVGILAFTNVHVMVPFSV